MQGCPCQLLQASAAFAMPKVARVFGSISGDMGPACPGAAGTVVVTTASYLWHDRQRWAW